MPRSCCIVGCQTGYKSNPDTFVSTFSFPKNESLRKKWINVIPRKDLIVTKNSAVCANHFTEDYYKMDLRVWRQQSVCPSDKPILGKIGLSELKEIFHCESTPRQEKIKSLKSKVDMLIDQGSWEADEIFSDHNYNNSSVLSCIIYYTTGYVSKKIAKNTSCQICLSALKTNDKFADLPEAELINLKSKGGLTHPNIRLFQFLYKVEECFAKHCNQKNVFDLTVEDALRLKFSFPCFEHKNEIVTSILTNFIVMRMRHFAVQENRFDIKKSRQKKKIAKLIST